MKRILVLVFFIYSGLLYSQKLEFIEKRDTLQKPKYQQFIFISDKTDISESIFVAKIKSTGSLKKVSDLYLMIKDAAQRKGANSFKFESFKKIDSENGELILSAYYVEGSFFDINFENLPKNKIYIFGNQNLLENKTQSYKVKSEKYEIENGKYKVFDINESEDIKMNGPRSRAIGVSRGKFIFSFMKTLGFQTFLFYPRSRASGYLSE